MPSPEKVSKDARVEENDDKNDAAQVNLERAKRKLERAKGEKFRPKRKKFRPKENFFWKKSKQFRRFAKQSFKTTKPFGLDRERGRLT